MPPKPAAKPAADAPKDRPVVTPERVEVPARGPMVIVRQVQTSVQESPRNTLLASVFAVFFALLATSLWITMFVPGLEAAWWDWGLVWPLVLFLSLLALGLGYLGSHGAAVGTTAFYVAKTAAIAALFIGLVQAAVAFTALIILLILMLFASGPRSSGGPTCAGPDCRCTCGDDCGTCCDDCCGGCCGNCCGGCGECCGACGGGCCGGCCGGGSSSGGGGGCCECGGDGGGGGSSGGGCCECTGCECGGDGGGGGGSGECCSCMVLSAASLVPPGGAAPLVRSAEARTAYLNRVLAHHPNRPEYRQDVYHAGPLRLCIGCFTTYPVFLLAFSLFTFFAPSFGSWIWIVGGFALALLQAVSSAGLARRWWIKAGVKTGLGLGLAAITRGVLVGPWPDLAQAGFLALVLALASLSAVPRMVRMRRAHRERVDDGCGVHRAHGPT